MKRYYYFIIIGIYLLIGLSFYIRGYVEASTFWEGLLTAGYTILMWPVMVTLFLIFR